MKTAIQLTPEQLESYHRDGFIIVEDLVSPEFLEALRNRMREYTHEGRSTDGLFVQVEPRVERGELQVDHPGDGIRKIEKLVEHDDLFQKLAPPRSRKKNRWE